MDSGSRRLISDDGNIKMNVASQSNPWHELPGQPDYLLAVDRPVLDRNPAAGSSLHLELHPVPFIGNPATARVLLLNLNPSYGAQDVLDERDTEFREELRGNLTHAGKFGFFLAHPKFDFAAGTQWWLKQLRWLIDTAGSEQVIRNLASVERFPYHSESFSPCTTLLRPYKPICGVAESPSKSIGGS